MSLLKQIATGTRFGRLVTVSQVYGRTSPVTGKAQGYVKCRCDCGSPVVEIIAYDLRKEKNPVRACRDCATIAQVSEGTVFGAAVAIILMGMFGFAAAPGYQRRVMRSAVAAGAIASGAPVAAVNHRRPPPARADQLVVSGGQRRRKAGRGERPGVQVIDPHQRRPGRGIGPANGHEPIPQEGIKVHTAGMARQSRLAVLRPVKPRVGRGWPACAGRGPGRPAGCAGLLWGAPGCGV
jgi:hypothetical protein